MNIRPLAVAAFAACSISAYAGEIVELGARSLAAPEITSSIHRFELEPDSAVGTTAVQPGAIAPFALFPIAGTYSRDFAIPYFVDLDASAGVRDFDCGTATFNEHDGIDAYLRSFREQEIGVPVFAPADGIVSTVRDGQPDQNTTSDPAFKSNEVFIEHGNGLRTDFGHLRRGSIRVAKGDFITAGTEIARVGSSGPSVGPHVHFGIRLNGETVEPFAGPCSTGMSLFADDFPAAPPVAVLGSAFSVSPFSTSGAPAIDAELHTGTFVYGTQQIYFRADIANLQKNTTYRLDVTTPSGRVAASTAGELVWRDLGRLSSLTWGLNTELFEVGTWTLTLVVGDTTRVVAPFRVVGSASEATNRAPVVTSAALEPVSLVSGSVPVCRVTTPSLVDADYDVVSYRYEWQVDGVTVRSTTSAATSDAIGREYARAGARISCSVTPTDGIAEGVAVSGFATIGAPNRRRATAR